MTTDEKKTNKSFFKKNPWIIIPMILIIGYIFFSDYNSFMAKKKENDNWNEEDYKIMVDECKLELKEMAVKYPKLSNEYCDCSTKKVQAALTKQEYNEIVKKPLSEQLDIVLPFFKDCLTEYQTKIKAEQTKQN